jgi:hypothetical protein
VLCLRACLVSLPSGRRIIAASALEFVVGVVLYFFERSSSYLLSMVVEIVESALESVFGVEGRIIFESSSSSCCRRPSLLLKVRLSPSSVFKAVLF